MPKRDGFKIDVAKPGAQPVGFQDVLSNTELKDMRPGGTHMPAFFSEPQTGRRYFGAMSFYPAAIVAVNAESAVARIEATGKQIVFPHTAHNAVPTPARQVGAKGFISFPKAPPVFTLDCPDPSSATEEIQRVA